CSGSGRRRVSRIRPASGPKAASNRCGWFVANSASRGCRLPVPMFHWRRPKEIPCPSKSPERPAKLSGRPVSNRLVIRKALDSAWVMPGNGPGTDGVGGTPETFGGTADAKVDLPYDPTYPTRELSFSFRPSPLVTFGSDEPPEWPRATS